MNKERRDIIAAIATDLERLGEELETIRARIEDVQGEEQEGYDNLPESFQNGDRGERMQTAIYALQSALDELDNFDKDSILSSLEEARE